MSTGSLIRMAREAAGLTQEDLEERSGIKQPQLSRWELDRVQPRDQQLAILASSLGVTPAFFRVNDRLAAANAVTAHARRRATASPAIWRRLEARINLHRIRLQRLAALAELRPALPLQPAGVGIDPEDAAQALRMQWRIPMGPVYPLMQWLEAAGVIIVLEDFGTDKIVGLSQWDGLHPVMLLNRQAPADRLRWTLAHELGHLVLHEEPDPELEREADDFAAEFLMPAAEINSDLVRPTLQTLLALKQYWMVSVQALVMHAHRLDRIDDSRKTSLFKQMASRGWRRREPGSAELPPEVPELVKKLVGSCRTSGLSDAEAAEEIYEADPEAHQLYFGRVRSHLRAV